MLINEASKRTGLTKKAIEYYSGQGLIAPTVLDNGYRDFSERDVERLHKISVLRKLELSAQEIKAVLADETANTLKKLSVRQELHVQQKQAKKNILDKLSLGKSYVEIGAELKAAEQGATVAEKLLDAFPGYYGRFLCLHFARFLNEPVTTDEQQGAYQEMLAFLDNTPPPDLPEDLQAFLEEQTNHINVESISEIIARTKQSLENPEQFLSENKNAIEDYLAFKQSDAYKKSPWNQMQALLKDFHTTSGYYDIFIPAMKRLSKAYAQYFEQLNIANEKLISQYPEIGQMNDSHQS